MFRAIIVLLAALLVGCDRNSPLPTETGPGQLTQQERERVSKLQVKVGGDANYPPFVYQDASGKLVGLSVDFFEETAKQLGLKYEISFVGQRAEMLKRLEAKQIDITLASRTASSRPYLIVTQPYEYSKGTLLVRKGFNPDNIKTVGAGRGYASVTWLKQNKPQYEVVEVEDDAVCIQTLQRRQVDSCIMGREIAFFLIDKLDYALTDFDLTPVEYNYFLSFGIHAENIELADILIKGLEMIPNEKRRAILKKWLKEPYL